MIFEIAELVIKPEECEAFEKAVYAATPQFKQAKGCLNSRLFKVIEEEGHYRLMVGWETVEHHLAFRETPLFREWRKLASPFFVRPPSVYHINEVFQAF